VRSRSLLWSFNYAIEGIVYALRTQRNMRLHMIAAALVLTAAVVLDVTRLEMVALLFAIGFVLFTELVNTAIESAVDLSVQTFDPRAKVAKDVAAGGVLISSVIAVAVGYVIFFDRAATSLPRASPWWFALRYTSR
jgi:diacylglycerol kinase (ATP)